MGSAFECVGSHGWDGVTHSPVVVDGRRGGALGAAIARVRHGLDRDFLGLGLCRQGQGGQDEEAGKGLHGWLRWAGTWVVWSCGCKW